MNKIPSTAEQIAQQIVSVQPMDGSLGALFKGHRLEEDLIKEGYVPLDPITKVMWVKRPSTPTDNQ